MGLLSKDVATLSYSNCLTKQMNSASLCLEKCVPYKLKRRSKMHVATVSHVASGEIYSAATKAEDAAPDVLDSAPLSACQALKTLLSLSS